MFFKNKNILDFVCLCKDMILILQNIFDISISDNQGRPTNSSRSVIICLKKINKLIKLQSSKHIIRFFKLVVFKLVLSPIVISPAV